jgi:hypothetical protein
MTLSRRLGCSTFVLGLLGAAGACSAPVPVPGAARPVSAALASFHPPAWASPARRAGRLDASAHLTIQAHLGFRDEAGARALLAQVSDPASPAYRQFLSADAYDARFAPSSVS